MMNFHPHSYCVICTSSIFHFNDRRANYAQNVINDDEAANELRRESVHRGAKHVGRVRADSGGSVLSLTGGHNALLSVDANERPVVIKRRQKYCNNVDKVCIVHHM